METTIIPVASGKGGVGKSVISANLAIALAKMGHPTVAIDLDLGGSNLYTCLGVPNKYPGIGDYLKAGNKKLGDFIVPTKIPNLGFLPGDGKIPFMANISYKQRVTLFKEIRKIRARYIVADLSAGTMFNMLNFFGLSYHGAIVTSFETPSIMNFMMFLRNFMFRVISGLVHHNKQALMRLVLAFHQNANSTPTTVETLFEKIAEIDPALSDQVRQICASYRPRIIFNMGDHPEELKILKKLDGSIRHGMSLQAEYFGFIFNDDTVRMSAKKRKTLLRDFPNSVAAMGIEHLANRVVETWDRPIENSMAKLVDDTRKQYIRWKL